MKAGSGLTEESFDRLLLWLDADRERAGRRYEEVRSRLIRIFISRGCTVAEELADETFDRVAGKMAQVAETYVGSQALYCYGVAQKVFLEYLKKKRQPQPIQIPQTASSFYYSDDDEARELRHQCLEQCLASLSPENRRLILEYYSESKQAKIERRKMLAQALGLAPGALRIKAYRIRVSLEECLEHCLSKARAVTDRRARPYTYDTSGPKGAGSPRVED